MRAGRLVSWGLLVSGLATLGYAGAVGQLDVHLVVVVPVISGTGPAAALGGLATIAGLAGLFWTALPRDPPAPGRDRHRTARAPGCDEEPPESEVRGGGVILLGPIPIAWGSDRPSLTVLVVLGVLLTLAAIAFTVFVQP